MRRWPGAQTRQIRLVHAHAHAQALGVGHARDELPLVDALADLARKVVDDAVGRRTDGQRLGALRELARRGAGELHSRARERLELDARGTLALPGGGGGERVRVGGPARDRALGEEPLVALDDLLQARRLGSGVRELDLRGDALALELRHLRLRVPRRSREGRVLENHERFTAGHALSLARGNPGDRGAVRRAKLPARRRLESPVGEDRHGEIRARRRDRRHRGALGPPQRRHGDDEQKNQAEDADGDSNFHDTARATRTATTATAGSSRRRCRGRPSGAPGSSGIRPGGFAP